MLGGLGSQQNKTTCSTWWSELQVGFKYLLVTTLSIAIVSIFVRIFVYIFANVLAYTIYKFQVWRLITSFLVDQSFITVLFNVYLLSIYLPHIERLYSTVYVFLQIIIQNVLCNTILYAISIPLVLFNVIDAIYVASFGMTPIVMIFMWQTAAINPEQSSRFCFFPCSIPMKHMPWCFFIFFVLFGGRNYVIYIGCLFGYYQYMVRNSSLLKLPLSFYKKLQSWLPKMTILSPGFISISSVQTNLKTICRQTTSPKLQQRNHIENNIALNDKVDVAEKGVPIGGSSPTDSSPVTDYRSHWLKEQAVPQKYKKYKYVQQKQAPAALLQKKPNLFQESQRNLIDVNNNLVNSSTVTNTPFISQSESKTKQTNINTNSDQ